MKPRLIIFTSIVISILSSGTLMATDDWPMFHHDLALTGYSSTTSPDTSDVLWIYDTQSASIGSSPAIVDWKLYIGSGDGKLYALDAKDGSLLWTYDTGSSIISSPAVDGGNVYFLSTNGNIYALNANTGALVWSTLVGPGSGSWDWSSPAVHNGNVFIASSNGYVHCLDSSTGAISWSTNVGGAPNSEIALANGKVYSGTHNFDSSSPTLVALDESTGAIVWTYDYHLYHSGVIGMINCNGAAIADGDDDGDLEVYFGVYNWDGVDDQAVCLDEATGTEVWTSNINGNSTSTPAIHDGLVFIGSDDYSVYALDAEDGTQVWSFPTGGEVWSAPAVADGKVFVGSLDHTIYALNEKTGAQIWSYYTSTSRVLGSPAIAYGNVYVGNENGKIYAFGLPYFSVKIDIKPQSCPNPLNVTSNGVLPVAILGMEDFNVRNISWATLDGIPPIKFSYEDVATPVGEDADDCECTEAGHDGYEDLVLHFATQEIVDGLGGPSDGQVISLKVVGELSDGTGIEGEDCIVIRNKVK